MPLNSSTLMTLFDKAAMDARAHKYRLEQHLSAPATQTELDALQECIPFALETSFLDFLRIANGAELDLMVPIEAIEYNEPCHIWGSRCVERSYQTQIVGDQSRPRLVLFGKLDADYVAFDPRQQRGGCAAVVFVDHDNYEAAYYDAPIAGSFEEWLRRTLQSVSNGRFEYWIEPDNR